MVALLHKTDFWIHYIYDRFRPLYDKFRPTRGLKQVSHIKTSKKESSHIKQYQISCLSVGTLMAYKTDIHKERISY